MQEISLNILDIVQNSVVAKAKNIGITIIENTADDKLTVIIEDDGCGMSEEFLKTVADPFSTTRTTRKVGLGIPLFKMSAIMADGSFNITSKLGIGTKVTAEYKYSHIDRPPIGDMASTMQTLIIGSPIIEFTYLHKINDGEFLLDTKEIRKILQSDDISNIEVLTFIKQFINENINSMRKENKI